MKKVKIIQTLFSYRFLIPLGIIFIVLYFIRQNNNFIRIRGLFKDYINIFGESKIQAAFFFGVPVLFAVSSCQLHLIDDDSFDTIYVVVTILITLFFSVLTVLLGKEQKSNEKYKRVLEQTVSTLLLEIIMCIYIVLFSFVYQMLRTCLSDTLNIILSGILYYFLFFMCLNLFIVVKRFKILIDTPI